MRGVRRLAFLLLVLSATAWGCVERKLIIRTEPPGAVVLLDNKVIGTSPIERDFTFYGARKVEARWDPFLSETERFQTVGETRYLNAPWYQWFPLDLLFEFLWPFTITDERVFDLKLRPFEAEDPSATDARMEGLTRRADSMRARTLRDREED
jgi:hypothetical protein